MTSDYGHETERRIQAVVEACERYGSRAIIGLAGVPGTGKTFVASIAAQRFTNEPLLVREIQFHQSFTYEEFIEGMRIDEGADLKVVPGVFLDWNEQALQDPDRRYVLLVEELTRANMAAVLGELMTYIEHRERPFLTVYSRRPVRVARNLTVLTTYNPTDRSALELDTALLRRLRVISFPPSTEQLAEMLKHSRLDGKVINKLQALFDTCAKEFPAEYEQVMPFGHGIFADVGEEEDLYRLWTERISHMLRRPLMQPHPFTEVIERCYPWRDRDFGLA